MNNRGFLLLEVVVSIVIITTGLLFIIRSYSSSKDSIQKSIEILKTSLLLEKKMWEFEEKDEIEEGEEGGDFEEFKEYSWRIDAERIEDSELNLFELTVFQKRDPQNTRYSVSTYLKNRPK